MSQNLHRKVVEWRAADSQARAVEQTLTRLLFERIDDSAQTQALQTQAKLLRQYANEKLKAAIAAMRLKR